MTSARALVYKLFTLPISPSLATSPGEVEYATNDPVGGTCGSDSPPPFKDLPFHPRSYGLSLHASKTKTFSLSPYLFSDFKTS